MSYQDLIYSVKERIATITLNRPERRPVPTRTDGTTFGKGAPQEVPRQVKTAMPDQSGFLIYSALIPAALMTFDHFAISVRKNSVHCSGVLPMGS